ncbi:MAG: RDD family protein, partial [Hymenobacter sp.]
LGRRIVAALLDNLIIFAWAGAVFGITFWILGDSLKDSYIILWVMGLLVGIPYVFYNLACEVLLNGQSLGKKAMDLRVVRLDGTAPRLGDYFLRWLLRLVDTSLPGIGGLVAIITIAASGKGQRLGDMAAGTTVISLKPRASQLYNPADQLMPEGYQPVFPQAADLTDHDVALLRQLLSRSLQQDNYLLLNETATKIKHLLHVESDLSDEAFLRTILRDHAHIVAVG